MQTLLELQRPMLQRVRWLTGLFMAGLILSGLTAIPIDREVTWLVQVTGARQLTENSNGTRAPEWASWLIQVDRALEQAKRERPMLFYGTDWLAFGHLIIALAFMGAWREPVRNIWLFQFGLLACALVIPWALVWGAVRGFPLWWRLIDCSFGIVGAAPLWLALRTTRRLEALAERQAPSVTC